MSTEQWTKVADIRPYMKGVNVHFIVLEKVSVTKTKEDHTVNQYLVADPSGAIILSVWDEPGELLQPGDIIQLRQGYSSLFKNALVLYTGRQGILERVGEFTMLFSEVPNMSQFEWVPDAANPQNLVPVPPQNTNTNTAAMPNNMKNQFVHPPTRPL
jgi:hypothetical protein